MREKSRVVLITGANGDIGRSLARAFAETGARVALCDLATREAAAPLLDELARGGTRAFYHQVDVSVPDALHAFVEESARSLGGIDICLANAGVVERGRLLDLTLDAWRRTLDVNLTGSFLTAQAAARVMIANRRPGQIVFTGSWVQDIPREDIGAYCASKGGLKMLAKCLALELAEHGIRVNVVAPGWVDAGLTSKNLALHPELRVQMENQIPLGRLMPVDEFARTVRLLCSEDASYITGTTLLVDGGASLCLRKQIPKAGDTPPTTTTLRAEP
jgi:glucose 1-dehydrogenase